MKQTTLILVCIIIFQILNAQKKYSFVASLTYDKISPKVLNTGLQKTIKDEVVNIGVEFSKPINDQSKITGKLNVPIGTRSAIYNYRTQELIPAFPFYRIIDVNNYMHVNVNFLADLGVYYDFEIWAQNNCCCNNSTEKKAGNSLSLSLGGGVSIYKPSNNVTMTSSKTNFTPFKESIKSKNFTKSKIDFDINEANLNVGASLNYLVKNKKTGKPFIILSYGVQKYFNNYFNIINTTTGKKTGLSETNQLVFSSFGIKVPIVK